MAMEQKVILEATHAAVWRRPVKHIFYFKRYV